MTNEAGVAFGHIAYLYENADADIMVIKNDDKERHIPFVMNDTVKSVDLTNRQVVIDWEFEH